MLWRFTISGHYIEVEAKSLASGFHKAARQLIHDGLIKNKPSWDREMDWWKDTTCEFSREPARLPEPPDCPEYLVQAKQPTERWSEKQIASRSTPMELVFHKLSYRKHGPLRGLRLIKEAG